MIKLILPGLVAFLIPLMILPIWIKYQIGHDIGQKIRQEGPNLHQHKTGTPTMGGLAIILAIGISLLLYQPETIKIWVIYLLFLSFGLVGFLDDFIKFYKARSLGLKARTKIIIQIIICIFFLVWFLQQSDKLQNIFLPFTQNSLFLSQFYLMLFIVLVFISTTNAVNLTDGLDGLATGLMIIALIVFALIAWHQMQRDLCFFCILLAISCSSFLIFNYHPAKIFLGDIGSLGLGGVLAAISIFTQTELYLLIIGGVFVLETLSVIVQVFSIKIRKKPVFLMSPLHHHFELLKWKEKSIVLLFWGIGVLFSIFGFLIYFIY